MGQAVREINLDDYLYELYWQDRVLSLYLLDVLIVVHDQPIEKHQIVKRSHRYVLSLFGGWLYCLFDDERCRWFVFFLGQLKNRLMDRLEGCVDIGCFAYQCLIVVEMRVVFWLGLVLGNGPYECRRA